MVLLSLDVNLSFSKGIGPVIERNRDFHRIDNYNSNEFLSKISSPFVDSGTYSILILEANRIYVSYLLQYQKLNPE